MRTGGSSSFDLVFPCFFLITRCTEGHIFSLVVEKTMEGTDDDWWRAKEVERESRKDKFTLSFESVSWQTAFSWYQGHCDTAACLSLHDNPLGYIWKIFERQLDTLFQISKEGRALNTPLSLHYLTLFPWSRILSWEIPDFLCYV